MRVGQGQIERRERKRRHAVAAVGCGTTKDVGRVVERFTAHEPLDDERISG